MRTRLCGVRSAPRGTPPYTSHCSMLDGAVRTLAGWACPAPICPSCAVRLRHAWPWCAVARCARRQGLEAQSLHEFVKAELPTLLDVLAPSNDAGMDDDDGSRYPHPAGPPRLFAPRST